MLRRLAHEYGAIYDVRMPDDVQGAWIGKKRLMLVDDRLDDVQRRCVIAHELSHAKHGDAGCRCDRWIERRADMEASAMLIDIVQYAFVEQVYGGNIAGMARELNVVPWVIRAFRERLHDDPSLIVQ